MTTQRLIIAGSRDFKDRNLIEEMMFQYTMAYGKFELVSGTARGVDQISGNIALEMRIKIHDYPAYWDTFGKAAGYIRNVKMAKNATALLAIWDGTSKGTKHMIDIAIKHRLSPIIIHIIQEKP